jgi:sigma-B regulation protein RsbU (phosphoserine phosphatase)
MQFQREEDGFSPSDIEHTMIVGNLIGGNNSRLLLVEEIKSLNERLNAQLEEVARVQASLLPREKPDMPGLDLATSYLTSDRAGGDYYDFLPFPDGTWGILIADVSGHGPAAATIMAMLRGILHCYAGDRSPDSVLRFANARLVEAGIEGTFVTAFFAVYDPRAATVTYARAGHNPPILKDGRTGAVTTLDGVGSLPLGILEPLDLRRETVTLHPGDTLILYTDGITEAREKERGEMFGPERLDAALVECSGQPDCVVDSIHAALYEHTGERSRADDQTIVALRYVGPPGVAPGAEVRVNAAGIPARV